MAIDQASEMLPRAAIRATPIDPMIKPGAQKAGARTLRFCNQESSSKEPATAQTNTAMTKSVGISSDMEAPAAATCGTKPGDRSTHSRPSPASLGRHSGAWTEVLVVPGLAPMPKLLGLYALPPVTIARACS
jgi:hypothetical protein